MPRERLSRADFIAIAADLADEFGLDQLSITRVSRAAGISTPGAYKHVSDLADLRRGIAMQTMRDAAALVREAGGGRGGVDALAASALALWHWARQHPGRYAALQTAVDEHDHEHAQLSGELVDAIAATLRAYQLPDAAQIDAVRTVRSLLHGFIMLELANGFQLGRAAETSFERAIRSLDAVFRSWGAP